MLPHREKERQIRRKPLRRRIGASMATIGTWLVILIFAAPIIWTLLLSFRSEADAASRSLELFAPFTFDNYFKVFGTTAGRSAWGPLSNSIIASFGSTLLAIVIAIPAAYALSLEAVRKSNDVLFFLLSTKFLPVVAALLPQYLFAVAIRAVDSRLWLVLLYIIFNLPIAIWLLASFMSDIPKEVQEAASLDGASRFRIIGQIVIPVIKPGLVATALICVILSWTELLIARTMTGSEALTAPVFLTGFVTTQGQFLAQLSAASIIVSLPILFFGLGAQRQLVRGLSLGAIK